IEGGTKFQENVQTTLVPAGGAAIVEFKTDVPGSYVLVDHALFRAFNKGALGLMKVEGAENKEIYSGKTFDTVYLPEGSAIQKTPEPVLKVAQSLEDKLKMGKIIYNNSCAACHQPNGQGIPAAFPPLAKSDWLNADLKRSIGVVKNGLSGPLVVNGEKYNSVMPALGLSDADIANVLTFVTHSWGNKKKVVTPEEVKAVKKAEPASMEAH
ncbi:MAG: c-type cytochrome, partial [Bdellovibrionaceae bacterium]|nr:c-type cytochrome [Pseudobdellovibrionaceae bacterium]